MHVTLLANRLLVLDPACDAKGSTVHRVHALHFTYYITAVPLKNILLYAKGDVVGISQ